VIEQKGLQSIFQGHALDSDVTKRYMRVREGTMINVFEKIAKGVI